MAPATHPLSVPGENTRLYVFNVTVKDLSIVRSKWVDYEPVQMGTNPTEFVIKPLTDHIDINNGAENNQARRYTYRGWQEIHSNQQSLSLYH